MYKIILLSILFILTELSVFAQFPHPALIGYWHNWNDTNAPYIPLDKIDPRYNVIEIAFAVPASPTDMTMVFVPDGVSQGTFISQIQQLQSLGKKVLLSIGGANASIDLTTTLNKDAFVNSISTIINTYGFDGIDIDIEHGNSILISGGTILSPTNNAQINLIDAIKQIMANYRTTHPQKLLLTMAPETAYVQGGQSAFSGIWGGYLPIIHGLSDSLDILQVQLYNSGTMYGIDGNIYTQGTGDFIVSMTEAVIHGFQTTTGGMFIGLPASKVAVGLPACISAAGGGYADTSTVNAAMAYVRGNGPQQGSYTLTAEGGYPSLRGMMTWSINWDAVNTCASDYQFAEQFEHIFDDVIPSSVNDKFSEQNAFSFYPNPSEDFITLTHSSNSNQEKIIYIYNIHGDMVMSSPLDDGNNSVNISHLPGGIYLLKYNQEFQRLFKL